MPQDLGTLSELRIARNSIRQLYEAAKKVKKFSKSEYDKNEFWSDVIIAYESLDSLLDNVQKTKKGVGYAG